MSDIGRLTDLSVRHKYGGIDEPEKDELISLMLAELNARATTIEVTGSQLNDAKEIIKSIDRSKYEFYFEKGDK